MLDVSLEIWRKQTNLPMGELRLSGLTMIDKEFLYMANKIENKGIYQSLVSQLDKLARHNRQGSFRTKDRYYQAMKRFCAYLADEYRLQKLTNINGKHLTSYVLWMQENGKSASTINQLQFFIMTHRDAIRDADSDRPMTFHGLRHTYGAEKYMQMIQNGTSALAAHFEVSRLLGHKRPDVTDIYLSSIKGGNLNGK